MEYRVDLFEPDGDLNSALNRLTNIFAPLYTEAWVKKKSRDHPGLKFDMNVAVFANMWYAKASKIFLAMDEAGRACGYLVAIVFRPMTHNVAMLQIEDWYGEAPEIEDALFNHVYSVMRYMGIDEVQINHGQGERYVEPPAGWAPAETATVTRYVKV